MKNSVWPGPRPAARLRRAVPRMLYRRTHPADGKGGAGGARGRARCLLRDGGTVGTGGTGG